MSGPSHTHTEGNRSKTTNTNDNKSNSNLPESSHTKRFFGGVFNKNLYGSPPDMMNHSLQLRNQNLTVQLVQAKKDWEALQKNFRANTHGRFVYQTTLARIVSHVKDFCDPTDPKMVRLVHDLVQWTQDCEHIPIDCRYQSIDSKESGESNQSKMSTTSNDSSGGGDCSSTGSVSRKVTNRGPIIDYADVQPFVDTSTVPMTKFLNHHESLQDQNDSLQKEIAKWQQSMARIRTCNQREAVELLCHQKTLRKVVERIEASTFSHVRDVQLWYEQCQQEAERCGSFSEPEAREFCRRCHSKLSNDEADSDQECIEDEEHLHNHHDDDDDEDKHPSISTFAVTEKKTIAPECPTTPSTVATATMEEPSQSMDQLPQALHMQVAEGPTTLTLPPSAKAIAAANVEDPPEIIQPTATNIQESSRMQMQPTVHRHSGCGDSMCCVM